MNRFARRSLITLGTGAAVLGTVPLSAGASGASVAGKGVTSTDTIVAGTNWDSAPGTDWAGPTVIGAGWAGPTAVEV